MIRACSWCSAENCGVITADGATDQFREPAPLFNEDLSKLVGRPIRNLSRMTSECRACLCAAALALKTCGWLENSSLEIGLVGAGYEACLIADQNYFRDYVASGRSLGRGNLFIYTLPSSTLGEVAIALTLTGPGLHIHAERDPLGTLVQQAEQFVADGEAEAMLALWSDSTSAICLAIDRGPEDGLVVPTEADPTSLARRIASRARPA